MARRPFYGQGGAIPIAKMNMQAATAPGRAYAQMGKDFGEKIGGAIKQYGLNKVKQKKADARIKSAMSGMPEFVEAGVLSPEQKTMAEEFLNDPSKSSVEKIAFIDEQEKRLFQLPKMQLMQNQNRIAGLEADLKEKTNTNDIAMSGLKLTAQNLLNQKSELNNRLLVAREPYEKKFLRQEIEKNDAIIKNTREATRGAAGKNDIFEATKDDLVEQSKLKTQVIMSEIGKNFAQVNKLQGELEVLGDDQSLERKKLEAQIQNLQADAQNKLAEADVFTQQADQMRDLLEGDTGTDPQPSLINLESIEEGAQGDLFGQVKNAINGIGDYLTLGTKFEETKDAKAQVASLRNALLPAFIEGFSERGAEWAKKTAMEILPNEEMADGEFRARIKDLPNKLREKLRVDKNSLKRGLGTEAQQLRMSKNLDEFPVLIRDLERILEQDKKSEPTTEAEFLEHYR
tara:strand:- start:3987 stop:5360 length:1374 start_codon:yes stop_codon:yes gene_type:complete